MIQPLPQSLPGLASSRDIAVNALWVVSLILSLLAALFGIAVKQWLREYMHWNGIMPIQLALAVRQQRHEAFLAWKVPQITATLPVLLQLGLALFLCGLVCLLWTLDQTISYLAIGLVVPSLSAALVAIFLPVLIRDCPYRSPFALIFIPLRAIALGCLRLYNSGLAIFGCNYSRRRHIICQYARLHDLGLWGNWNQQDVRAIKAEEFDRPLPADKAMKMSPRAEPKVAKEAVNPKGVDGKVLTWINVTFQDDNMLQKMIPCFRDIEPRSRLQHLLDVSAASMYFERMTPISEDYSPATSRALMQLIPEPISSPSEDDRHLPFRQQVMQRFNRLSLRQRNTQVQMIFTILEYEADFTRSDRLHKRTRHDGSFVDVLALLTLICKSRIDPPLLSGASTTESHGLMQRYTILMVKLLCHLGVEQHSWGHEEFDPLNFVQQALEWILHQPITYSKTGQHEL